MSMKIPSSLDDASAVIEKFDSFPVEKRVEIFRKLSAQAKEELLECIARPQSLTRRLSDEEAFFTIKELGEENAPALVASTSGRQLQYILDIDMWNKDQFDVGSAARWLNTLARLGDEKLIQFAQAVDPELLVTALSRIVRVVIRNPDYDFMEQQDSLPPYTLDDTFYVDFRIPEMDETIKRLLESLFHWKTEYYFAIMEELARGLHVEIEETALKWRRARLADHGFPEFDEALDIYKYLARREVTTEPGGDILRSEEDGRMWDDRILDYPLAVLNEETLLKRLIREIDEPREKDRLCTELAHVANKVMVADGRDPGSPNELYGSLRKVGGFVSIALEESCGDNMGEALDLLRANHSEILFRRGFSLVLDLRKQAHRFVGQYEGGVENLGHPLAELIDGLFRKRPYYAAQALGENEAREFEFLSDIERISALMTPEAVEDRWEHI